MDSDETDPDAPETPTERLRERLGCAALVVMAVAGVLAWCDVWSWQTARMIYWPGMGALLLWDLSRYVWRTLTRYHR
ncbi:hypothetical protein [Catellatospora tritici]|uniref:hypothetical protein n=1 Tax=Catellatospora tritici TaxID=2851566 RepID=UPI001C2D06B0|nr:hypothetical protein [Catellatospora tritici]MBV1852694.1 hypothetical protein [Catellatospora tritici]